MHPNTKVGGSLLKRLIWRIANSCLLGGLITWPLELDWVRIERRMMPLANLGHEFQDVKIVHISDLHCGTLVREKHLHRYVEIINSLDADFAVITGDFITTGSHRHAWTVAGVLHDLHVKTATIACLGNHDYGLWHPRGFDGVNGIADYLSDELTNAGVIVLRNNSQTFFRGESALQFTGLEDYWSRQYDPESAFEYVVRDWPMITLVHNPDVAPQLASQGAGWILAGHTHGKATPDTRFWNAVYPTRCKQFVAGHYALGSDRHLYVNRGIGNTFRVRCEHRPEITLFTLCPAKTQSQHTIQPSKVAGLVRPENTHRISSRLA